jgi:hypothetical protein
MKPRVLLVYYSYTNQTRRVAQAMREAFQAAGWEVELLEIELVDERYRLELPLRPFWRRMLKLVWPQLLGTTGQIRFDEQVAAHDYQLVCIGSPTWWFYPALPVRSFLRSPAAAQALSMRPFAVFTVCRAFWWANLRAVRRLATRAGGEFVASAAFVFQGNQVQSMLTFLNYLQTGQDRERYLGCRIYPFGVTAEGIEKARSFAQSLAERLGTSLEHNSVHKEN